MTASAVVVGLAVATVCVAAVSPAGAQDLTRFSRKVEVGGQAFPVLDFGEGSPVLLLHGFPDDRYVWRNQALDLANAGLRVVAPDLRGFGDAPLLPDTTAYSVEAAAKDVIGILDALRIGEVQMIGHGLGATIGWHIAARYPTRVSRFVALSAGAPGGPPSVPPRDASSMSLEAMARRADAETEIPRDDWAWLRSYLGNAPDTGRAIERLARPGALTAALNWYRAPREASGETAGAVRCEVLGIWSDGDAYYGEDQMRSSGERIKGTFEYKKISGASHWMMLDKARELNRLVLAFLQREI